MKEGRPALADARLLDVAGVVWCTGFEMGLYFVGPHLLFSASSTMIHGIGRDADWVARTIAQRVAERAMV